MVIVRYRVRSNGASSAAWRVRDFARDNIVPLLQAGLEGLDKGLDRFDPDRGVRITSVCHWWVSTAVRRTQQRLAHVIKVNDALACQCRLSGIISELTGCQSFVKQPPCDVPLRQT